MKLTLLLAAAGVLIGGGIALDRLCRTDYGGRNPLTPHFFTAAGCVSAAVFALTGAWIWRDAAQYH